VVECDMRTAGMCRMMWETGSSGGLGQRRPIPNSWERGEGEEDIYLCIDTIFKRGHYSR